MLLNKLPCLDKGYVALIDSMNGTSKLLEISKEFFNSDTAQQKLLKFGYMTLAIRCPIFVLSVLSQHDLKILHVPEKTTEAYIPNATEIKSGASDTDRDISGDIENTTQALLINPKAYQSDGCDRFASQVISPVSTYVTIIASGDFQTWDKLVRLTNLPDQVEIYRKNIDQIFESEWRYDGQTKEKETNKDD
jgi:hypothetical protein